MKTITTYYEVLGIEPDADLETLRQAYRLMARKFHPDVNNDPRAHETMAKINEAFSTLNDSGRRSEYDAALAGGSFATQEKEETSREEPELRKPIVVRLKARLHGHNTPIYAATFEPISGRLVSSAFDNELLWWDVDTETISHRMKIEAGVVSTLQPVDDVLYASGASESTVAFWRVKKGKVDGWRSINDEWASSVAISPDGSAIATGSLHHALKAFSTANGSQMYQRTDHTDAVTAIAYSADGQLLVTGGADSAVKMYHAETGALLQTIRGVRAMVTSIAFSPDGKYLAVAAVDLSIRVFTISDGGLVKMMFGHTKPIEVLAFHPNGWLLASASRDGTVGLWNAAEGIGNVRIECSTRPISAVAFSHDGELLAAGGQDKILRLWNVKAKL